MAVIVSTQDIAALNIKSALINSCFKQFEDKFDTHPIYTYKNAKLYTTDTDSIYCENLDNQIDADLFIFATRHSSKSGIHSLSVHVQGNWGKAEFGGKDKNLGIAPAPYLKEAYLKLKELGKDTDFEIIQEVTHHGPELNKPCMFIEIGSNENQWDNKEAAKTIAKTIIHLIENEPKKCRVGFGIGGLHHSPILSKLIDRTDIGFGHICPKYNLENLNEEMIRQALLKSYNQVELIILDWKGMGKEKDRIVKLLDSMGLKYQQAERMLKEIPNQ